MVCSTGSRPSGGPRGSGTVAAKSMALPGSTASASGSAIEATDSAAPGPPAGHIRRATTYRVAPRESVDSASRLTQAAVQLISAHGTISSAANGG